MQTKKKILWLPFLLSLLLLGALAWGGWMLYDTYVDRSGWVEKDGVRFYRDFHGDPVSGWLSLPAGEYYFQDGGIPLTGWQSIESRTYYFGSDGIMATGWLTLDGDTYYLGEDGVRTLGWLSLQGNKYYLPEGILVSGWQEIEGEQYYFDEDGTMVTGFLDQGENRYYFGQDGILVTGAAEIDGTPYLFGENGAMVTGWVDEPAGRRYYLPEGGFAVLWMEIAEKRYYFNEDGFLETGWRQEGEYRYYLLPDGSAAVGPHDIDGERHYFSPKGIEVILVNEKNPLPSYFTPDPVEVYEWRSVDSRCYDALIKMMADCEAAGNDIYLNSGYRSSDQQAEILEARTQEHMDTFALTPEEATMKALETVAVPGTSEHQLGLAVDLVGDDAKLWLAEHCWEYGFIRRYQADKAAWTGIVDEPWHFRYVGVEVSMDMKDSGLCLEEYLGAEAVRPWELT